MAELLPKGDPDGDDREKEDQESVVSQSPTPRVFHRLSVADRPSKILILIKTLSTIFRKKSSWRLTEEISV